MNNIDFESLKEFRKKNFACEIRVDNFRYDPDIKNLYVTTNGYQWHGMDFTKEEARSVIKVLADAFEIDLTELGRTYGGNE
jgi:hypothetical protein